LLEFAKTNFDMPLADYLFVDEARLDSYFEQISSPLTFEKKPTWKAGVSLSGPVAEGSQSVIPRPHTRHEKICTVLEYLKQNLELRNPEQSHAASFGFESLNATPVHIPLRTDAKSKQDYLNLWVGTPTTVVGGYRFLLEGFSGKDDQRPAVLSAFSCLQAMLDEFGETLRDFVLTNINNASQGNEVKRLDNVLWDAFNRGVALSPETGTLISRELERAGIPLTSPAVVIDSLQGIDIKSFLVAIDKKRYTLTMTPLEVTIKRDRFEEANALLISEPLPLFAKWGAKLGEQRPVDAFYRIRRAGRDAENLAPVLRHVPNVRVVGYPILLTAHPGPFTDKYVDLNYGANLREGAKVGTPQRSHNVRQNLYRQGFFRLVLSLLGRHRG
jgi:hypothetical protein